MVDNFTVFDKNNIAGIHKRLEIAISLLEEELGLKAEIKTLGCSATEAIFGVALHIPNEDGEIVDPHAVNFKVFCQDYGLKESDLGKSFISNDIEYSICGLKPKNRKFPIIATRADGKRFKFSNLFVRKQLGYS